MQIQKIQIIKLFSDSGYTLEKIKRMFEEPNLDLDREYSILLQSLEKKKEKIDSLEKRIKASLSTDFTSTEILQNYLISECDDINKVNNIASIIVKGKSTGLDNLATVISMLDVHSVMDELRALPCYDKIERTLDFVSNTILFFDIIAALNPYDERIQHCISNYCRDFVKYIYPMITMSDEVKQYIESSEAIDMILKWFFYSKILRTYIEMFIDKEKINTLIGALSYHAKHTKFEICTNYSKDY